MMFVSTLERLIKLSCLLSIDLRVKRDDLLPIIGGGNKVRKILRIIEKASLSSCDALVTTGGLQSNHARVVALYAASKGWPCTLILHGSLKDSMAPRGNFLLMKLSGANISIVEPEQISANMQLALEQLRQKGYMPLEIPGGGHCLEGALAYYDAVQELYRQCSADRWQPDFIIHASGTGTTQAGIVVGLEHLGWETKVIGVSVARTNPRGKSIVEQSCSELSEYLLPSSASKKQVDFRDDWVGEGYEKAGSSVFSAIRFAAQQEGLILDPTYTGKAFSALLDLTRSAEIPRGSRVLFWHTGGLLNLMSSHYIPEILSE